MPDEYETIQLRARIAELESRVDFLYKRLNVEYVENAAPIDPRIMELVRQGNKIGAIKIYRELYNVGLVEAKNAVDQMG